MCETAHCQMTCLASRSRSNAPGNYGKSGALDVPGAEILFCVAITCLNISLFFRAIEKLIGEFTVSPTPIEQLYCYGFGE